MAFSSKKLISLLVAIISAVSPIVCSLVNNSLPNSQHLKLSFFFHPNKSKASFSSRRKRDVSKQYEKVLQAKIEKVLFGETHTSENHKGKDNSLKVMKELKQYSLELEKTEPTHLDAVCKLVDTNGGKKKMFQCSGPNEGPLSSMVFEFA